MKIYDPHGTMHQLGGKSINLNTSHHITSQHTDIHTAHIVRNMSIVQTLPREPNENLSLPRSAAKSAGLAQLVSKYESLGALPDVDHRASGIESAPKHRTRGRFHAPRLRDAIRLYEALTRQDDKAGARDTSSTQSAKIAGDAAQHRTSNLESRLRWSHSRLARKLSRRLGTKETQQDGTTVKGGRRPQSPGQQTCRFPEPRDEASSRERISHGGATLVAQASCALEQPKPVRANEMQQLLGLCRGSDVTSPTVWRGRSQADYC
ncbi:hypothetical protein CDD80_5988 [Ophiocordyceps camponoti-rufipedis]|uniref:Uncharacterized protein n=1 Tax=Ophiocordyceps camponoti-rufipedis TaxID=2004952 RepID=A0A2C5XFG0_9HYPO|nr:hypothetical protein CDD80_5988 [Ophiocordyceps camponoti-rufipedis]